MGWGGLTTTQNGYGWAWQQLRLRILARDRYRCHWCDDPDPATSVDHVIPKADGGSDDPRNLVAAHVRCNSARSMRWNLARRRRFLNHGGRRLASSANWRETSPGGARSGRMVHDPLGFGRIGAD